ncbi:adenylate/guanylate cyclase domain-containing protein [Roseiconus lacunae]|uniref:Adenylate/guanylate cyclase domain-containing protein n=1 Tax=Roseiconus lacunae TaxID=2605694 RepID=A0ABT7PG12_9BACT|nr:adenylate/guanylate cyclase domain-containing protein [Roseiconus lacunae]MDM4015434.1 adenylate/guanylate cyclase domain-containing protein [Roseiconus lacunae]
MAELIAQGPQAYHRWRREIPNPTMVPEVVIGRTGADWNVPWDSMISRRHVRLVPQSDHRVEVSVIASARNPVFHQGRHAVRFALVPGDHFVIGNTTFTLASGRPANQLPGREGVEVTENVFDHVALRRKHFRNLGARIDVLTRLPDLIASSESDQELLVRVTSVLLQSTPSAESVAILSASNLKQDPDGEIKILHYDNRSATLGNSPISRRLVERSMTERESILNVWEGGEGSGSFAFTAREDVDWAFCVPLRSEACRGWVIYVSGQIHQDGSSESIATEELSEQLQDDVKFAEIVGTTVASLRQSHLLQRRQAAMGRFFAPIVMRAIAAGDSTQVLRPREADLAVMFCDLRGFSKRSEQGADQLLKLLSDVSDALGVMTKHILGFDGVIGDFHGDAAMGFWGWPLAQADAAVKAASAAIAIREEFKNSEHGFRCGIGLALGPAVAGQIGTTDQVKVTAFGPVVNLASRLESMTKRFGAEIILDQPMRKTLTEQSETVRLRRLAKVCPAGMTLPVEISELVSNESVATCEIDDELIERYEAALDLFQHGELDRSLRSLRTLPTWDGPTQFLIQQIVDGNHQGDVIHLSK